MRRILLGAVALGTLLLGAPASASAGTLDQSQPVVGTGWEPVWGTNGGAQGFTAGLFGSLDQVDLSIDAQSSCAADLIVEIRQVDFTGMPTGTIFAVAKVSRLSVPSHVPGSAPSSLTPVTFPQPVQMAPGVQYAIVLPGVSSAVCYSWYASPTKVYSGGTAYTSSTDSFTPLPDHDYGFRTYVEQASAPAPTAPAAPVTLCRKPRKRKHRSHKRLHKCTNPATT